LKALSDAVIHRLAGAQSYQRGLDYFSHGHVESIEDRGGSIHAVVRGNQAKFGQHPELADFLRRTGAKVLVEASPFDRIWGIGIGRTHEDVARPGRWRGLNLLGFALMDVREEL